MVTISNSITVYNIYNANDQHNAAALLACQQAPRQKTVILGDFNIHYRRWEPQLVGSPTNRATKFIKWLDSRYLTLLSNSGDATHNRGHILNLAFATPDLLIWGASAIIENSLHSTSDHSTLTITIPLQEKQRVHRAGKLITGLIKEPVFRERLQLYPLPPCTGLTTEEEIDREAVIITEAISRTAASLVPRKRDSARGSPW